MRNYRIEKFLLPLDESLNKYFILRPAKFVRKPLELYQIHPILIKLNYYPKKKSYNKTIVNRWHLLLRLSLNIELTVYRKMKLRKKYQIDYENEKQESNFFIKRFKENLILKRIIKKDKVDENNFEMRF